MNHKTANLIRIKAQNNNNIKQKDAKKDEHFDDQINKKSLESPEILNCLNSRPRLSPRVSSRVSLSSIVLHEHQNSFKIFQKYSKKRRFNLGCSQDFQ